MPLPYRTILHLPPSTNVVRLAEQELQSWVEARKKVEAKRRSGFATGEYFRTGVHVLARGRTLSVARIDNPEDGNKQLLLRFVEETISGTWQVEIVVLHSQERSGRPDTLLIEASRADAPDAPGQVDPPSIVSRLLARVEVHDSQTPVTAQPQMVRAAFVDEVIDAIVDEKRSVTVIVASSIAPELDSRMRELVQHLTSKLVGVASVFVLTADATAALNRRLPESHRIEPGRVRTYLSAVDLENPSDGRRHRVLGPQTFARAIRGKRVAEYLQRSFAFQTRSSLLAKPIQRQLRRQWSQLDEKLARITREFEVERKIEVERKARRSEAESRKAKTLELPKASPVERLMRMLSRWLGRDLVEFDDRSLDSLSDFVERQRFEVEAATRALSDTESRMQAFREEHDEYVDEFEYRELELAEAERAAAKLSDEARYLRRQLTALGRAAEAHAAIVEDVWEPPSDLGELALRITPGTSDHPVVERIVFTGDLDRVVETELRDQNGLYVQRCWEFIRALHDYVDLKRNRAFAGGVHAYLCDDGHDGFRVTPTRHAASEAKTTMEQWGRERVFPVPAEVSATRTAVMEAHFKAGQQNTFAPRMYYYDDTSNTGKVYIGYIGRHLTNTKTKNS